MDTISIALLWLGAWYLVWGIFNMVLIKNHITLTKRPLENAVYFTIVNAVLLFFLSIYTVMPVQYLVAMVIGWLIFIPLKNAEHKMLVSLFLDVCFQQIMITILVLDLSNYDRISAYIIFVALFFISHLPVLFLKHIKLKGRILVVMLLTPVGAASMFFLYNLGEIGWLYSLAFHYLYYVLLWFFVEKRSNVGLIA